MQERGGRRGYGDYFAASYDPIQMPWYTQWHGPSAMNTMPWSSSITWWDWEALPRRFWWRTQHTKSLFEAIFCLL
jgi:hypothetical protein